METTGRDSPLTIPIHGRDHGAKEAVSLPPRILEHCEAEAFAVASNHWVCCFVLSFWDQGVACCGSLAGLF